MNAKGSGLLNERQIRRVMKLNGYALVSAKKHMIFKNESGDTVSLPKNCKNSVLKYEFKHHNIKKYGLLVLDENGNPKPSC